MNISDILYNDGRNKLHNERKFFFKKSIEPKNVIIKTFYKHF